MSGKGRADQRRDSHKVILTFSYGGLLWELFIRPDRKNVVHGARPVGHRPSDVKVWQRALRKGAKMMAERGGRA